VPLAEGRRTPSQVHRYVEDLTSDHPHKFSLRMAQLVMQPAKNVSRGERLIVLHEPFPDSELGHDSFVIALQKKASLVLEDLRFEKQDSGNSAGNSFHDIGLIDSKNVMIEIQGQVTAIVLISFWRGSLGPPLGAVN
jgi:hypothetical protein